MLARPRKSTESAPDSQPARPDPGLVRLPAEDVPVHGFRAGRSG